MIHVRLAAARERLRHGLDVDRLGFRINTNAREFFAEVDRNHREIDQIGDRVRSCDDRDSWHRASRRRVYTDCGLLLEVEDDDRIDAVQHVSPPRAGCDSPS